MLHTYPALARNQWLYWTSGLISAVMFSGVVGLPTNEVGVALYYASAGLAGVTCGLNLRVALEDLDLHGPLLELVPPGVWVVLMVASALIFAACAADWQWDAQLRMETCLLRRDFTGCLSDAQASNRKDREKILAEIRESGNEEDVNRAVRVLLTAGMSTSSLRL